MVDVDGSGEIDAGELRGLVRHTRTHTHTHTHTHVVTATRRMWRSAVGCMCVPMK